MSTATALGSYAMIWSCATTLFNAPSSSRPSQIDKPKSLGVAISNGR